jgi:hypothetical protein
MLMVRSEEEDEKVYLESQFSKDIFPISYKIYQSPRIESERKASNSINPEIFFELLLFLPFPSFFNLTYYRRIENGSVFDLRRNLCSTMANSKAKRKLK